MADDSKTTAEGAAPKSNKLVMFLLLVIAVLVAGGGTALFMRGQAGEMGAVDAKGEKGATNESHKEPAQYVKLDPPFVVNFEAKGLMRFLQVAIEIMTRDPITADAIKRNEPMIRNDLIMLLGSQKYETISSREGKDQLRAEALKAVATIIESEGGDAAKVEQLYFTSFVMQ